MTSISVSLSLSSFLRRINDYSLIDNYKIIDHIYVCNILNKMGIKLEYSDTMTTKELEKILHHYF